MFVFVGRIVRDKGVNELAECVKSLDCKLLLVGSPDGDDSMDKDWLEFLHTSPKVRCVGWQEDVRPYLAAGDALVLPSYREGFPNVPIQAGAMGLPCIVTDVNGCNEIIEDGINGKVVPAPLTVGSSAMRQALLCTMEWFLRHPTDARGMGHHARDMVVARYEQRDVWAATLEMYEGL